MVIFGPIADTAREKLAREEPDVFELASKYYKIGLMFSCFLYRLMDFYIHSTSKSKMDNLTFPPVLYVFFVLNAYKYSSRRVSFNHLNPLD